MKQIKKLSLSNLVSKLTRNEMRYIMAGSGAGQPTDCVHPACTPVCATPSHPNSYCATTVCTRKDGTTTTFQSCQFY